MKIDELSDIGTVRTVSLEFRCLIPWKQVGTNYAYNILEHKNEQEQDVG